LSLSANLIVGTRTRDPGSEVRGISDSFTAYVRIPPSRSRCPPLSKNLPYRLKHLILPCPKLPNRVAARWTALLQIQSTPEQVSPLFACAAERRWPVPFTCKTYVDGALAVRSPYGCVGRFARFAFAFTAATCSQLLEKGGMSVLRATQTCPFTRSVAVQMCRILIIVAAASRYIAARIDDAGCRSSLFPRGGGAFHRNRL